MFVAIDAQTPVPIGPAIRTATADESGHYQGTITYSGLTDGVTHQYRFFSMGLDGAGNAEAVHTALNDVVFTQTFAPPAALQVTGLTVERGAAERSDIRYLDIAFNESDAQSGGQIGQIAASIGAGGLNVLLFMYELNGTAASKTAVPLQAPTSVAVVDHAIELDFGAGGKGLTAIVVNFDQPMNPGPLRNLGIYHLATVSKGKKSRTKAVGLSSASYDAASRSVTLSLRKPVKTGKLRLTIDHSGVIAASGIGLSGGDYTAIVPN